MRVCFLALAIFCLGSVSGQYYFNDLIATQQSVLQYQLLRANKVKKIIATSYEEDQSPTEGFVLEQELTMDGKKLITKTGISSGKTSDVTSFFELGKLKRTQSNSNGIDNKMEYLFNEKGKLIKLTLTSSDTAVRYQTQEIREWQYNAEGMPVELIKVKNKRDSSKATFVFDEQGNIGEEQWTRKQQAMETYYYYYDQLKRLTDIVRYHTKLQKLVPDYVFEYDERGKLSQMTQLSGTGAYFTWKYLYNEKGLKIKETCFDSYQKVVGRIEYRYEFH